MKYTVGDTVRVRHGDGSLVDIRVVRVLADGNYELEGAFTTLPLYLSESVLDRMSCLDLCTCNGTKELSYEPND